MNEIKTDALIIGGGAAGMAAAVEVVERGYRAILIERDESTGGVLNQCIHNGFGLHVFKKELTGPEYAHLFQKQMNQKGVEIHSNVFVLEIDRKNKKVTTMTRSGICEYSTKVLIMCTGARERPFGNLRIPGDRPAGIFTAGVAQKFVNLMNVLPGKKAFVLGSGDIGLIMARRLTLEGMKVMGVAELMPYPGGLARNIVQCLDDFDIPLYLSTSVTKVSGKNRLESITLCEFDRETREAVPFSAREVEVDTLILSVGLIPQNELVEDFVKVDSINRGLTVDNYGRTSEEWIFAAGNNVAVYDLVDFVTLEGKNAGQSASEYIKEGILPKKTVKVARGLNVGVITPLRVCTYGQPFTLFIRPGKSMKKAVVSICGGLKTFVKMAVKPAEMIDITVSSDLLENIRAKGFEEIKVDIEEVE